MTASITPSREIRLLRRDVDRLDLDVMLKSVLVEEDSSPTEVSYVKLPRDVIMLLVFH